MRTFGVVLLIFAGAAGWGYFAVKRERAERATSGIAAIEALIASGKFEEAAERAGAFVEDHPGATIEQANRARAARAQCATGSAVAQLDRRARRLMERGRWAEAGSLLARLQKDHAESASTLAWAARAEIEVQRLLEQADPVATADVDRAAALYTAWQHEGIARLRERAVARDEEAARARREAAERAAREAEESNAIDLRLAADQALRDGDLNDAEQALRRLRADHPDSSALNGVTFLEQQIAINRAVLAASAQAKRRLEDHYFDVIDAVRKSAVYRHHLAEPKPHAYINALSGPGGWASARTTALDPSLRKRTIAALNTRPSREAQLAAALARWCSPDFLRKLGEVMAGKTAEVDQAIRVAVASNPATPADVLVRLQRDAALDVRRAIAGHPACPETILRRYLVSEAEAVQREVASNPGCPPALLAELVKSPWAKRALRNPNCPSEVLERTARAGGRLAPAVAANPRCPPAAWDALRAAPVSSWALGAAQNPRCPVDVFERLIVSKEKGAPRWIAAHPRSSPALLRRLATDADPSVRRAVARNPACPADVVAALAKDPAGDPRRAAMARGFRYRLPVLPFMPVREPPSDVVRVHVLSWFEWGSYTRTLYVAEGAGSTIIAVEQTVCEIWAGGRWHFGRPSGDIGEVVLFSADFRECYGAAVSMPRFPGRAVIKRGQNNIRPFDSKRSDAAIRGLLRRR